jgi:ribonuclease HII
LKAERAERRRKPLVHKGEELHCTARYEDELFARGFSRVAGVDEVGRGALCGPVVACAVVLGRGFDWQGIDDSKRLTEKRREALARRILDEAASVGVGTAEPQEIDRLNILRATHLAMRRALEGLRPGPDFVLVDGRDAPDVAWDYRALVKGDALSVSIAAASIVAKVERDRLMRGWDERCPGYGLASNMGYGSRLHREALRALGPSEIHRRSFFGTRERWLF